MENGVEIPQRKIELSYDLAIPLLGILSGKNENSKFEEPHAPQCL